MFNRHHGPDPEILALMHEEERKKLLRRGTERLFDEEHTVENERLVTVDERHIMDERQMLTRIMTRPSWLRQKDYAFVKSVSRQLEDTRAELSLKQAWAIRSIYERWQRNQGPHFVQGGSPGSGKRK